MAQFTIILIKQSTKSDKLNAILCKHSAGKVPAAANLEEMFVGTVLLKSNVCLICACKRVTPTYIMMVAFGFCFKIFKASLFRFSLTK